jgi:hypothetical protein
MQQHKDTSKFKIGTNANKSIANKIPLKADINQDEW